MAGTLPKMSVSVNAAEEPRKEIEHVGEQPPEAFTRPSAEELEVARELVRTARERGTALMGPGGLLKVNPPGLMEALIPGKDDESHAAPRKYSVELQ